MIIPDRFKENMISCYGEEETAALLRSFEEPVRHALRVNTLKISINDFLSISPFSLRPVPWCENAFYYDPKKDNPSLHPFYYAGLYYLQEPSATLPASVLPVREGDRVLDLCAAPGGKSTALLAKLKGTGVLISNDISASRARALLKNLEIFGGINYMITTENSSTLSDRFGGYFDKILIDAPCSGEGMFRKSSSMITAWERNGNQMFAEMQRVIIRDAVKMLAPGGSILYSTCTYSPLEDEEMVLYILQQRKSFKIQPFDFSEGFMPGKPENLSTGIEDIKYTAHLFPHRVEGEGHYVALIKDCTGDDFWETGDVTGSVDSGFKAEGFADRISLSDLNIKNNYAKEFLEMVKKKFPGGTAYERKGRLYFIPNALPDAAGLRTLRNGLYLGEIKQSRFEPSQSLAMVLNNKGDFLSEIDLDADDIRVKKYLKGETIAADADKGWVLIRCAGFPLGFGKASGGQVKNKYLPGWRMMS